MKTCTRCKEEKSFNEYLIDKRRLGKPSMYQQPCKKCRTQVKSLKHKIEFSNNDLSDNIVKKYIIRRNHLLEKDITKDLINLVRLNILLKRELKREDKLSVVSGKIMICNACNSCTKLPDKLLLSELNEILSNFEKIHELC